MTPLELFAALMAPVILGMIWLRTRVQYSAQGGRIRLQRAGWLYFGGALGLIGLGWLAAPPLAGLMGLTANPAASPMLRAAWCLATYYLFIGVHQLMKANKLPVFGVAGSSQL
jgi:hypothetical protein